MAAIRSATYWPAVLMGVESDVGTFTPGKYADIIADRGYRHQTWQALQVAWRNLWVDQLSNGGKGPRESAGQGSSTRSAGNIPAGQSVISR